MTPQEWIACVPDFDAAGNYTPETMVHEAQFVAEGATHLAAALEEIAELRNAAAWIVECEKWDSGAQLLNEKAVAQARIEHRRSSMQVSPTLPPSIEEWMMLVARKQGRDESAKETARLRAEAGRVVVPERAAWLTIDEMIDAFMSDFGIDLHRARDFASSVARASKAKRAHSVPSSRVLKDGEVAVDKSKLRESLSTTFKAGFDFSRDMWSFKSNTEHVEVVMAALDALRTQATATESGEKGGA